MRVLILLFLLAVPAFSQTKAGDLSVICGKSSNAVSAKGKWDGKKPDDIYAAGQCEGFIEGWIEGMNGSILTYKTGYVLVTIKQDQIKSMWDLANALILYLNKNPLEAGKPADTVLRQLLLNSDLLTLAPVQQQITPTSQEQ